MNKRNKHWKSLLCMLLLISVVVTSPGTGSLTALAGSAGTGTGDSSATQAVAGQEDSTGNSGDLAATPVSVTTGDAADADDSDEGNVPSKATTNVGIMGQIQWDDEENGWDALIRPTAVPSDPNTVITLWKYTDDPANATQITLQSTDPSGANYCRIVITEGIPYWSYSIGKVAMAEGEHFYAQGPALDSYRESEKAMEKEDPDAAEIKLNYIVYKPDFQPLTIQKKLVPDTATGSFSFTVTAGDAKVPYKGSYKIVDSTATDAEGTVKSTTNGTISGVGGGKSAVLTGFPAGVSYEVTENGGNYIVSYDSAKTGVVAKDGTTKTTVTNISNDVKVSKKKRWNDNNDPNRDEAAFLKALAFEYRLDDGDWAELDEAAKTKLGIEGELSYSIDKTGFSNWTIYGVHGSSRNFPAALVGEDGTVQIIEYRIVERALNGYVSMDLDGVMVNTKAEDFDATIRWKDIDDAANRPEEVNLTLVGYYWKGEEQHFLTAEEFAAMGIDSAEMTVATDDGDSKTKETKVSIPNLPMYSQDGYPITYYMTETTPDGYSVTYDNGDTAYGTNTTQCYNGGTITNTRRDNTTYSASKTWVDAGGEIALRPAATVYLYRYVKGASPDTASPVVIMDKQGKSHVISKTLPADTPGGTAYTIAFDDILRAIDEEDGGHKLFKYDAEGREYIYFVKEILTPSTDPTTGEKNSADYSKEYKDAEGNPATALYDGGTLLNSRIPLVDVHVGKKWASASLPDVPAGTVVTLKVKVSSDDGTTWEYLKDGKKDLTVELSGFSADQLTRSQIVTLPQYNEDGVALQYQVEEVSVKKDGKELLSDGKMTLRGHTYQFVPETLDMGTVDTPDDLDSRAEADLIGANVLLDEASYTVKKKWSGVTPKDTYAVQVKVERYLYDGTKDSSFTPLEGELTSEESFTEIFTNLPLYDAEGYRYDYRTTEVGVTDDGEPVEKAWSTLYDYQYDLQNKKIVANITNYKGGTGKYITVTKQWKDDGDTQHRLPVVAQVYDADGNEWTGKSVTLSESNGWTARLGFDGEEELEKYNEGITVREKTVGDATVDYSGDADGTEEYQGVVSTDEADGHIYKVKNEELADGNWRITNLRYGTVQVEVDKHWVDGGRSDEDRPAVQLALYRNGILADDSIVMTAANAAAGEENQWVYQSPALDKYDEDGKQIVYTVKELSTEALKNDEYVSTLEDGEYDTENSTYHSGDVQHYTLTNTREGITEYKVYKIWKDTELTTSRPDIRVKLYYSLGDSGEVYEYGTGALAEYQTEAVDYVWSTPSGEASYDRMCLVTNLMKYSPDDGSEIHYYSKEIMDVPGDYKTYYWKDANCQTAASYKVKDDSGDLQDESFAGDGEYIENRLEATINLNGTKLWLNLQNGTKVEDLDTSNITIQLYRYTGTKPADFETNLENYFVEEINLKEMSKDNRKFLFQNVDKYSPEGKLYTYEMRESIGGNMEFVYRNDPSGFQITNTFVTGPENNRTIKVKKSWDSSAYADGIPSGNGSNFTYPKITFELFRSSGKSETDNSIDFNGTPVETITVSTPAGAEESEGTFSPQLIWSENGIQYKYAVRESVNGLPAYVIPANEQVVNIEDTTKYDPDHLPSVAETTFENTYDFKDLITLKGTKVWKDANNEDLRPDDLELKVYRKANGTSASTAMSEVLLTEGADADYTVKWTKNDDSWEYEISGPAIAQYAPNGQAFTYRVVEEVPENYNGSGQATQSGGVSNKVQKMTTITNNLNGSYTVSKTWDDNNNEYGLRPTSVVVALQKSTDGGTTWEYVKTENNNTTTPLYESENDGKVLAVRLSYSANKWTYTFPNLDPTCEYRGVEIAAGVSNGQTEDTYPYYLNTEEGSKAMIGSYDIGYTYDQAAKKTTVINKLDPTTLKITKSWSGDSEDVYNTRPKNRAGVPTIHVKLQRAYIDSDRSKDSSWEDVLDSSGNPVVQELSSSENNYTWEIKNLPKCDYSGRGYVYRARELEDEVQSYETTYDDSNMNVTGITNELYAPTEIGAKKTWHEGNTATHPTVTIELTRWVNGKKLAYATPMTITLDGETDTETLPYGESDSWVATWAGLPSRTNEGDEITYKVEEIKVGDTNTTQATYAPDGTKAETGTQKGLHTGDYLVSIGQTIVDYTAGITQVSITNTKEMAIQVTKTFSGDTYATRPTSITVEVQRKLAAETDWTNVREVTISGFNDKTATKTQTIGELPKYNEDNEEYEYRIVETKIGNQKVTNNFASGYDVSYSHATEDDSKENWTISNTMRTINISGTKEWDDQSNFYGLRPSNVTVKLYANGSQVSKQPNAVWSGKDSGNTWNFTFSGLPQYDAAGNKIVYTVKETGAITGYEVTNNSLTGNFEEAEASSTVAVSAGNHGIVNKLKTVNVEGTKTWSETKNGSADSIRPQGITLTLKNGNKEVSVPETKYTAPTEDNNWSYKFAEVPQCDSQGKTIVYTVDEAAVPGYTTTYDAKHLAITNTLDTVTLKATKVWDDQGDNYGIRPTDWKDGLFTVYADGVAMATQPDGSWSADPKDSNQFIYTVKNLQKYKLVDGVKQEITYTVQEDTVPDGYTRTVSSDGKTITNTLDSSDISVTINWTDNSNAYNTRPTDVVLTLQWKTADGEWENVTNPPTVTWTKNTDNTWTYTYPDLPEANADGDAYSYRVIETVPGKYHTDAATVNVKDGKAEFTNVFNTGFVQIQKVFGESGENGSTARPKAVFKIENTVSGDCFLLETNAAGVFVHNDTDGSYEDTNGAKFWLIPGVYTLTEQSVGNGTDGSRYAVDTTAYVFTVTKDQTTTVVNDTENSVFRNQPIRGALTLTKMDEKYIIKNNKLEIKVTDGESLSGAEFNVCLDEAGEQVVTAMTPGGNPGEYTLPATGTSELTNSLGVPYFKDGKLLCGTYYIVETTAPTGYYTEETQSPKEITIGAGANATMVDLTTKMSNTLIEQPFSVSKTYEVPNATAFDADGAKVNADGTYVAADAAEHKFAFTITRSADSEPGFEFTKTVSTNADGIADFGDIPYGTYTVSETATNPYVEKEDFTIVVDADGVHRDGAVLTDGKTTVENALKRSDVKGTVVDAADSTLGVAGAVVGLYDGDTCLMQTTTDKDGKYEFPDIPYGNYTVKEVKAPENYVLPDTEKSVTVNEDGATVTLPAIADRAVVAPVMLRKVDNETGDPLENVSFTLAGTDFRGWEIAQTGTTDENGRLDFADIPVGTYTLTEVKVEDYETPATFTVNVVNQTDTNSNLATVVMKDAANDEEPAAENDIFTIENIRIRADFTFTKTGTDDEIDLTKASALEGATFGLFDHEDATGDPVQTVESDEEGAVTFTDLPCGTWYVKELQAPVNFTPDETVYAVTVEQDGSVTTDLETVVNEAIRGSMKFVKVDRTNASKHLAGSRYVLRKLNSETGEYEDIAEQVTDENGEVVFENLLIGPSYQVQEVEAPAGYQVSEMPIQFEMVLNEEDQTAEVELMDSGEGTVELDENGDILWKEPPTAVAFYKVDTNGKMLEGAEFKLTDEDGNPVKDADGKAITWTSSKEEPFRVDGILEAGKTYTLTETKAPDGYQQAEPMTFTVEAKEVGTDDLYVQEVRMENQLKPKKPVGINTGDAANPMAWMALGTGALAALAVLLRRRKKRI